MKTIFEDMQQKCCPLKPEQEYINVINNSHEILIAELSAQHRKLIMKIIYIKDVICDEYALENFKTGFTLDWQIMNELKNNETNGHLFRNSDTDDRLSFKEGRNDNEHN